MTNTVNFLSVTSNGLGELGGCAGEVKRAIDLGKEQAKTRDGIIQAINGMADALQLACDLVSKELSASVAEFNQIAITDEAAYRAYFERNAARYSESSLRLLLHEGRVCGQLHQLGDRFRQPFSPESIAASGFLDSVKSFFMRSSPMQQAINGLNEGERTYLRDMAVFLNELVSFSEGASAVPWGDSISVRRNGEDLIKLMREKRQHILSKAMEIRGRADATITALH